MNGRTPAGQGGLATLVARAESRAADGDIAGAIALLEQALSQVPQEPYLLVQLSYMHSLAGRYRSAHQYALRASATGTRHPGVLSELLPRLRTFNEGPALLECVARMLPASQMPIPLLLGTAAQLTYLNLPERAIALLDEARGADPDYPPTLIARTQVLTYLGRFHEAEADVARALKRAPEIAQGWWLQSALRKQTRNAHHVDAIRAQLARPGRSQPENALLNFALHKELDDLGDHAAAWVALAAACQCKRAVLRYDMRETDALFSSLVDFQHAASASVHDPVADVTATPIFIVGMHRSGTTLLEQLLAGSEDVHGVGELYDFTSAMRQATDYHCRGVVDRTLVDKARGADLAQAGQRYLQTTSWRLGAQRFFTDKLPSNFLNIGFIARALPQARILHMVRDPVETCFSNLRELFSEANPYSYDQQELAHFHRHYRRLMRHWHASHPGRILDVDYARLVREPEAVLREVCTFCGLDFTPAMLELSERKRGVVTASAVQVRGGIQSRQTPKWAPYAAQLQPLIQALAED